MACSTCNCAPCRCQPANTVYECACVDPGVITKGRHLEVLDFEFCERRLENLGGVLNNIQLGSGAWNHEWSVSPLIALPLVTATDSTNFGWMAILGADLRLRKLVGPATVNKFLRTDANGMLVFADLPASTVPDPLTVTDLNATTANITDLNTTGTLTLNNIAVGAQTFFLGLNVANQVVKFTAAGIAAAMFFESGTSPSAGTPNSGTTAGSLLTIGNTLYDSGSNLVAVTNSTTLTVSVAGKYAIIWQSSHVRTAGPQTPGSWLQINGIVVNNGGSRSGVLSFGNSNSASFTGVEVRTLAVGDTIRLQNSLTGPDNAYEVRLAALKFADA